MLMKLVSNLTIDRQMLLQHPEPQSVTSPRSTTTTLICCANAIGNAIPPFLMFKGKRFNDDLMKGATPGSRVMYQSPVGLTLIYLNLTYRIISFLLLVEVALKRIQSYSYLMVMHHMSHSHLSNGQKNKHLILFVLPAHSSHVLQPLFLALSRPIIVMLRLFYQCFITLFIFRL
jgi:hypothetical protein